MRSLALQHTPPQKVSNTSSGHRLRGRGLRKPLWIRALGRARGWMVGAAVLGLSAGAQAEPRSTDAYLDQTRSRWEGLAKQVWDAAELANREKKSAKALADALQKEGFKVTWGLGGEDTAFVAVAGSGSPTVALLAEYDALPGLGHGCGHNTMAASGVGAAIALAAVADDLPGEIVFLGTPAEERGSGKQIMIEDGLFEGLDAALLYHPCDRSHVEAIALASEDAEVVFTGLQAHAASDPWKGRNALDAMILLFSSVGLWRQQLKPSARVHGIIREGGTAANIIPDRTAAWFMIRSDDEAEYRRMRDRFRELCEAAALATETSVEVTFSGLARTMRNNPVLAERFRANMGAYGIRDQGDDPSAGSTDMANVSWICPTIHPDLAIAPEGTPGHSILFRDAAATPQADETTLLAATLVAQTAADLFLDPVLVEAAWRAFREA